MEPSTLIIDNQVDALLHKVAVAPRLTLTVHELFGVPVMDENMYRLDHFMLEKGLLKITGDRRTITGKGLEIVNFGGWSAYKTRFNKQKPRSLYAIDNNQHQKKHELEIAALKQEIQEYKLQLEQQQEREAQSINVVGNLIRQNRQSKLMFFIAGATVGLLVAGTLSFLLF